MINLGPQYYRPPFPVSTYWQDDVAKIKDAGFNCLQLWVMWSWVEAKPGKFNYDDYDRIIDCAEANGLKVVLSTIAEVHPYWIHRVVPDCELVTNRGQKVVSENRNECHNGLSPGGCFDHPEVWKRMSGFIRETAAHYQGRKNLAGWDAWNELRWNVGADGPVCYCRHTVKRYREWLEERFGSLDGLNREWLRRYDSWEDVMPGKNTKGPYTSSMSFAHFLTWRSNRHAADRYKIIKALHPDRAVTVHGSIPCMKHVGWEGGFDQALNRGNDWFIADELDGIGCSNFPAWANMRNADFTVGMEMIHSAAREKRFWVSELQGGSANGWFTVSNPVRAVDQQRWIWNSIACGADTVLLWCWRDEVFCGEANGFGISGNDGFAAERIAAMQHTGTLLKKHARLIDGYRPAAADVAILFSPQTYYLYWAQEATAQRPLNSIAGFAKAMIRQSIPFKIVEEAHLEELAGVKILFLPKTTVLDDGTIKTLQRFVESGGTLYCEAETGAWDSRGIFRYPEDRFPGTCSSVVEIGRRGVPENPVFAAKFAGKTYQLKASQLLSPWRASKGGTLAKTVEGDGAMLAQVKLGKGNLILCGTYLGDEYDKECYPDFEDLVRKFVEAAGADSGKIRIAARTKADFDSYVYARYGRSNGKDVAFVFFPAGCNSATLSFTGDLFKAGPVKDLFSGRELPLEKSGRTRKLKLAAGPTRIAILTE
jgi:beta-galactosidase